MKALYQRVLHKIYEAAPKQAFTGCHKHRKVPGYEGGIYCDENVVYLTQRDHSTAHWLRWKLYGDLRDKLGSKMIGKGPSGLSHQDRVDHGNFCVYNKIGIHGFDHATKVGIGEKTYEIHRRYYEETGVKNFYYWSTPEGRAERASLGGSVSCKTNKAFLAQKNSFLDKDHAKVSGMKAAKKPVTNGKENRRLKTEEERTKFLMENPEWKIGTTRKSKLGR